MKPRVGAWRTRTGLRSDPERTESCCGHPRGAWPWLPQTRAGRPTCRPAVVSLSSPSRPSLRPPLPPPCSRSPTACCTRLPMLLLCVHTRFSAWAVSVCAQRRETAECVRGTVVAGLQVCPGTDTDRLPEGRSRHLGGCERKGEI